MMEVRHELFKEKVENILNLLYEKEKDNIENMAQCVAQCIKNDGVVHVFGTGHSVGFGLDLKGGTGSLVPLHIMQMSDFVTKGVTSYEEFKNPHDIFERKTGVADKFIDLYDVNKNDCFIIISNSGINGIVIDLADIAKKRGHKVIVITSMAHTLSEESRHPSGKKLYMFGDVVIDNCGPIGDALLETSGIEKVCSVSSICGNCIAQSMQARVCEILDNEGIELPVLREENNCLENIEFNKKLLAHYQGRI